VRYGDLRYHLEWYNKLLRTASVYIVAAALKEFGKFLIAASMQIQFVAALDMITAVGLTPGGSGLTPGGSSTSHIYTQTVRTIQR
jgi:hypothetical protein